jgi:hypothetical protein
MPHLKHKLLLASLGACMLVGCGNANRAKIIGTWGIDKADTVMSRIKQSGEQTGENDLDSSKMIIRFQRDGGLETKTQMGAVDREKLGQWKFVSFDPGRNSITVTCEIQSETTEHEITFVDENTIELVPPNMAGTNMKLRFRRQN